jgi:hypothetical protein
MENKDHKSIDISVGDLVQDAHSDKRGVVLEIKKWSYNTLASDVYVHWLSGDIYWANSDSLIIISDTDGVYNHSVISDHNLVTTISSKFGPPE